MVTTLPTTQDTTNKFLSTVPAAGGNNLSYAQIYGVQPAGGTPVAPTAAPGSPEAAAAQQTADMAKYFPGAGIVASSSPQVAADNATHAQVTNMMNSPTTPTNPATPGLAAPAAPDTSGVKAASTSATATLDNYMAQLEARRKEQIDSINAGFDTTKTSTIDAQNKETGSTTVGLARMGGYLGGSASGTGVMLNLAQNHRDEITALEAKRQAAITEANNAITDKEFDVARAKVSEAKDLENTIYSRQKDFWDQQLQLQGENRAQDTFLQKKYSDQLDALAVTGGTPDKTTSTAIDSFYGVPGFTQKYIDIKKADTEAKSTKALYDSFKSKIDLLESIPAGVKVKFGDETITGIGKTADIETFHVEDAQGNVTMVTHNKANGSFSTQSLGAIGTPSAQSGGTTPTAIADMSTALGKASNSKGYVEPTAYKEALRTWLQSGFTLAAFENNFKTFADPSQKDAYDFSSYYNKPTDQLLQALLK